MTEVIAGSLVLRTDGTFSVSTARQTEGSTVTTEEEGASGTYTVSGNTITFVDSGGTDEIGLWSGDTISVTIDEEGEDFVLLFER